MDEVGDTREIPEDIQDEALAWVSRLTSGEADAEDREAFALWRDQSPLHARALAEARELWTLLGPALVAGQELRAAESFTRAIPSVSGTPVPAARLYRAPLAMAAALVLAVAVGLNFASPRADLSADGTTRTRMLADGSRVTLGPGALLEVDFPGDGSRQATLLRGEALFNVAPDPARPFTVHSGAGQVRVLGTVFSVRRADGITAVTVQKGRVEVRSGNEAHTLTADKSISYGLDSMGGVRAVDATAALAWSRGWLVFENRTVADVIAELDRYREDKVILLNREAGRRRINGAIDLSRSDLWLAALEESEDLTISRLPGVVLIH